VRKRLWATVLELNVQTSLDSGTPPGISLGDFDTGPPSNVNDEELSAASTTLNQQPDNITTQTSLQRFLLRSLPDRLEMLHRMNGIINPLNDEEILSLSTRMSKACRECVPYCQPVQRESVAATESTEADSVNFKQSMAQLLLRRFLLILHRPLAGRIDENALYYHSRKVSFDTASALLKPVNNRANTNATFSNLMVCGGGLFRSCLNHISLALASELLIEIGDLEEGGREEERGGSAAYRQLLTDAVREVRDIWAERLRHGDANVRLHMKLSIVLGLVETEEDEGGTSTQQRMTMSAKKSLETCVDLIRKSYYASSIPGNGGHQQMDLSGSAFDLVADADVFQTSELGIGLLGGWGI
jgi:hypothetical protein